MEDLLFYNEGYDESGLVKESFTSIAANIEDDEMSLLEEFCDDDSLEDPFAFGTESIMKDIMEDEIYTKKSSYVEKRLSMVTTTPVDKSDEQSSAMKPQNTSYT